MKKIIAQSALAGFVLLACVFQATSQSTACTEYPGSFSEDFRTLANIDVPGSSVKYWCADPVSARDIVTLNKVGANFAVASPTYVPGWINAVAAGDFDLDGWPDYVGTSSSYSNTMVFVRNMGVAGQVGTFEIAKWLNGCTGHPLDKRPVTGFNDAPLDTSGHCALTAADYDLDGDPDFLYVCSSTAVPYPIKRIMLFRNTIIDGGVNTGIVDFTVVDMTAAWSSQIKGISWSSTCLISVLFDIDTDYDILVGNAEGDVLKLTNTNNGQVNASTFVVEPEPLVQTGWNMRGVNTVSAGDFDKTGTMDIIVGSVSHPELKQYTNDGTGHMTFKESFTDPAQDPNNNLYDGAATVSLARDFDRDGNLDLVVATDAWNYPLQTGADTGFGGHTYFFRNTGAGFVQRLIFNGPLKTPAVADFDLGIVFDFDKDGDLDFMIADGNHSENYYVFVNQIADVYNPNGTALSVNLTPTLAGDRYAITRVRFTNIAQSVIGGDSTGLAIEYFVSNNDGKTWELYQRYEGAGIITVNNAPWQDFRSFGSKLRWKAVLSAPVDPMVDFDNASFETPVIDTLRMEYVYVERREYSRTSAAVSTVVEVDGNKTEVLIAATFMFPGWQGHLRAYDVTHVPVQATPVSSLTTISAADPYEPTGRRLAPGATILWNAGDLLANRSASSRIIYAGYRATSTAPVTRLDFSRSSLTQLATPLGDPDNDNAGLIDFIRGEGRDWKLGDIQHSNPIVMGPPSEDAAVMGSGYDAFIQAQAGRTKVIFVGANDGMLHCFNATTGEEIWGYIPYDLVPKLKNCSIRDARTKIRYWAHDIYVDGTPSVGDVQIGGIWRTVLVMGQGAGKGSTRGGGFNYYFALDVTNPANPLPLWETTVSTMGETWSVPTIGKIDQSGTLRWVAFMGSGYDNSTTAVVGNRFYTVRVDDGSIIKTVTVSNVNTNATSHPRPYPDIYVTIPGSPNSIDTNRDGRTEYVYVGDTDGRMYRMDVTAANITSWKLDTIYTDRMNYPIITKPALWGDPASGGIPVRVYFGTGGDDRAPADRPYAFLALVDGGSTTVDWYVGNTAELNLAANLRTGEMSTGEKVWADPIIADRIVYFSSLRGSIENVNPCENLADIGRLYARYVQATAGVLVGGSALRTGANQYAENFQLASKARQAVTIGERQTAPGGYKREVFVQEYDSTLERLEQPVGGLLKITSWREIYKIIR